MFIPLMVVAVVAVVVAMDPVVVSVISACPGTESRGPNSHRNNHGRHQKK
jgi:hypothetical protein